MKHRFLNFWTISLFFIALLPRVFDLRQFLTSDENTNIYLAGSAVLQAFLRGDFRATYWHFYPGVTMSWLDALGIGGLWLLERISGATSLSLSAFADSDILHLLAAARLPYALLTALFVPAVYVVLSFVLRPSSLVARPSSLVARPSSFHLPFTIPFLSALFIAFDPFFLAHSRVVHGDAPVAVFMVLSALSLFVYIKRSFQRSAFSFQRSAVSGQPSTIRHSSFVIRHSPFAWLLFSAVTGALAALTKAPGQLIALFAVLTLFGDWALGSLKARRPDAALLKRRLLDVTVWGLVALATFILLWPSMWVDPLGTLAQMLDETFGKVDAGHLVFFMGQPTLNPGPWFYPYVTAFRLTPVALVGVILSLWRFTIYELRITNYKGQRTNDKEQMTNDKGQMTNDKELTAFLWYFVLFLLAFGLLSPKKQDRYLLPVFPALDILAVIGWYGLWRLFRYLPMKFLYSEQENLPQRRKERKAFYFLSFAFFASLRFKNPFGLRFIRVRHYAPRITHHVFFSLLILAQIAFALPWHPYYLSYFNPLLGGLPRAVETTLVGWGEGMEQAAAYLNQKPNAPNLYVASTPSQTLLPYFKGDGENFYTNDVAARSDYVVIYRAQQQRLAPSPEIVREYLSRQPEHIVKIHGVPYAWIYPNRPLITRDVPPGFTLTNIGFGQVMRLAGFKPVGRWAGEPVGRWAGEPVSGGAGEQESRGAEDRNDVPPSSFIPHPSSFIPHPSAFILVWHALPPIEQDLGPCHEEKVENITAAVCPRVDYTVSLRVIAPDGSLIAQHDSFPAEGLLPTSQWRPGDYVQDKHPLDLPPNLSPGQYRIEVVVYNAATGEVLTGPVEVTRVEF